MTNTARDAAHAIVNQMSSDDRAEYARDVWSEHVEGMLNGDWEHLSLSDVLDELDAEIYRRVAQHHGTVG